MNAADLVNPITPCLDTVYALPEALPRSPASDETLTIDPLPRCSMVGRTARVSLKPPVRLIAMTRSQGIGRLVQRGEVVVDPGDVRERADPVPGRGDNRIDVGPLGDVTCHRNDLRLGQRVPERGESFAGDVHRDDPPALPGDAGRGGSADPGFTPVTITVLPVNRTAVSCSFQPVSGSSVGRFPPFAWTTRSSMTDCGS